MYQLQLIRWLATRRARAFPARLHLVIDALCRLCTVVLGIVLGGAFETRALDLAGATVVTPPQLSRPEQKAIAMLIDEVERRSQVRWSVSTSWPAGADAGPILMIGSDQQIRAAGGAFAAAWNGEPTDPRPEGFRIRSRTNSSPAAVAVVGSDPRGVSFGIGHLLRKLRLSPGQVKLPDDFSVTTAPRYPLRGHQLGYRPKTHSYDAWDVPAWDQYFRDLIVFGANAVELVPPRSDDDADSPHFPLPPMRMMAEMSRLADDYGLDVWIWYPAMDEDYSDSRTVEKALREWDQVFAKLPRIDAVFVPGGDPGHTRPKHLMALLEKQTVNLHRTHPKAQMWVSPQSFNQEWLDEFLGILTDARPAWLSGIVFGPQVRISLPRLRAAVPAQYPIRHYPDITHTRQCQYPVPDWDTAFAVTEGRECINPRPMDQAAIFHRLQPHTIGFITYSEGCNDDVNKAVWSALGWEPERPVVEILRDFGRYFVSDRFADDFAQGLLALERNWRGPAVANSGILDTLHQFQDMERRATPRERGSWRFQQALFRAYYDAYTRSRLRFETALEEQAVAILDSAAERGSLAAMRDAEAVFEHAVSDRVSPEWRARIFELAEALFQSVRMQLSVPRYRAIAVDRGASLDTVDYPLNSRRWWKEQFEAIRGLKTESERRRAIDAAVHWTDPGPGGFYDDLGNLTRQPHLVRGLPFAEDPASLVSSKTGFEEGDVVDEPDEKPSQALRFSWLDHAESLVDEPLKVRYTDLDPDARYRIRILYAGDSPKKTIRLVANDDLEIHPFLTKPFPYRPLEFAVPPAATRSGQLVLTWSREPGLGGNGRGCQVSELWLMKE